MSMNFFGLSFVVLILVLCAGAQTAESQPAGDPTTGDAGKLHKQDNATSATQDNSAISGDQVTRPSGAKTTSVIGCLAGPDTDGKYTLSSMQYRSGVEVLGPTNLGSAAGQKVKLSGNWAASSGATDGDTKQARRFQATSFDVLAEKCPPPAETTPISKKKQKQQKAAAKAGQTSNPQ